MPPSEAGLAAIFGALDIGVILLDRRWVVIAWNPWLEEASGIAAADAIGKKLAALFPRTASPRFEATISAALESGVSSILTHSLHKMLFPLHTAAGQDLVHDVSIRPLGDKANRACLLQIDDVTVAAQRERLLRERHDTRYRELKAVEE